MTRMTEQYGKPPHHQKYHPADILCETTRSASRNLQLVWVRHLPTPFPSTTVGQAGLPADLSLLIHQDQDRGAILHNRNLTWEASCVSRKIREGNPFGYRTRGARC